MRRSRAVGLALATASLCGCPPQKGEEPDRMPPGVEGAQVSPELAGLGTEVVAAFTATEELRGEPVVTLAPATGARQAFTLGEKNGLRLTYRYRPSGSEAEAPTPVVVTMADAAGNEAVDLPLGSVRFDLTPPALSNAVVDPPVAGPGSRVTVGFGFSEPVQKVSLSDDGLGLVQKSASGQTFVYELTVGAGAKEGVYNLSASAEDMAGNPSGQQPVGSLRVDLTAPLAVSATLTRTPSFAPAVDTAANSVSFSLLDPFTKGPVTAELEVVADEELGPSPTLGATGPGPLAFSLASVSGKVVRFRRQLAAADAEGSYTFQVSWSDALGNQGTRALSPTLIIDRTPPSLSVLQSQVTYLRSPWGNAASESLGGFTVPAGPYFAVAPSDPLSSASTLPANTFTIDGAARPGLVRLWGDAAASALRGEVGPQADGTWARKQLAQGPGKVVDLS